MRGRKPKPTKLKVIEGNRGKRPLNKNEPKPARGSLRPPSYLRGKVARAEWRFMVAEMDRVGIFTKLDRDVLACYCVAVERWIQAEDALREQVFTEQTTSGNRIQNPLVGVANRAMDLVRKFASELGMSPTSRTRLSTLKGDELDLEDILE